MPTALPYHTQSPGYDRSHAQVLTSHKRGETQNVQGDINSGLLF